MAVQTLATLLSMDFMPRQRSDELIAQDFGSDLLIYHKSRNRAVHLEPIAAEIFRLCDGTTPCSRGVELVCQRLEITPEQASELLVETLARLERAGLVEKNLTSRRQLLKRAGRLAAGLAVASVAAPPAAMAQSCVTGNAGCASLGVNCAPCRQNATSACTRYCCPPNHYTNGSNTLVTGWRCRQNKNNCRAQPNSDPGPQTNICP